jgi:hypothetical protein
MTLLQTRLITLDSTLVAMPGQISSDVAGEAVILNLQSGIYYGLNEVGATVWNLIQQPQKVETIRQTLLQEYDVEPEVCTPDLLHLLQELQAAGLVEVRHHETAI